MEKLEAYRKAVAELGNVAAETLSAHIEQTYGIEIAPNFIPLYRASSIAARMGKVQPEKAGSKRPSRASREWLIGTLYVAAQMRRQRKKDDQHCTTSRWSSSF